VTFGRYVTERPTSITSWAFLCWNNKQRRDNMQKIVTPIYVGILAVAATFSAQAQSSVQIYGIVDAGMTQVSGIEGGSRNQLVSGIMEGSRWGLKGQEDLGGGYRALFTMESRLELDTGGESNRPVSGGQLPQRLNNAAALGLPSSLAPVVAGLGNQFGSTLGVNLTNNGFDRQAYVGLVTPVGAVIAGRQYTPAYEIFGGFDAMKTESALSAGQVASIPSAFDIRANNALQYRIQLAGWSGSLMYSAGESAVSNSAGRLFGGMLNYKASGYSFGAGYNTKNNELGQKSLTNAVIGATANLGKGTFSLVMGTIKDDNPAGLSTISSLLQTPAFGGLPSATAGAVQSAYINAFKQDARLVNVGYSHVFGNNTATVAFTKFDDRRISNADVSSYGFALKHSLSKRTDLNFVMAKAANSSNSQVALGGAGYLGGVTRAAGVDSTSIALGMRHRF
jgi:predicted porin